MSWAIEILGTGLVAGIVVQAIQSVREHFEKQRLAKLEAFKMSNELMVLSLKFKKAIENVQFENDDNPESSFPPEIKKFPVFPEFDFLKAAESVKHFDNEDTAVLADLHFHSRAEDDFLMSEWRSDAFDEWDIFEFEQSRYERYAAKCKDLAKKIRRKHKLQPFNLSSPQIPTQKKKIEE